MADRPVNAEEHLTDFESLLWTLERDPQLSSGFANITFLDRPADLGRMRSRLLRAAALIPQLRRRVYVDPAHLAPPRWIDDPDFSIERHVTARSVDPPGDLDAVVDAAMAFCHRPYDPEHPLWEFLLLDGLADGRGAMVQRVHHTISDGVGMVRMSEQFIDVERDVDEPDPLRLPVAEPLPSTVVASREALGHSLHKAADSVKQGLSRTVEVVRDRERFESAAKRTVAVTRALIGEATIPRRRRSPLWTQRTENRTLRLLRVPFDEIRRFAKANTVTMNDCFVAGAAGGAGDYHRRMGHEVDELRMAMPVNTREDASAAGNAFGTARVLVPTTNDPRDRLSVIHERLNGVRDDAALSLVPLLAGPAGLLPSSVLISATRAQVSTVDFTTSNVRGAPFPLFMGGALVLANHPIGPLIGTAFNLTMLSYNGSLDMGLHVDTGAIDDADLLAECIDEAFDELLSC